jgi:broad specificity phosphatase PhoE
MTDTAKTKPARGRVIVSRHGRPALDRTAGPKLDWVQYRDWWERYEIGSLAEDQEAPKVLIDAVADFDIIMSSARIRSVETARWATGGREPIQNAVFNEAPLPPPRLKKRKFLPKTWNILARMAWLRGHSLDGESVTEARARAKAAALVLHEASEGKTVYCAAHGWFNRMLRRPMKNLGWVCVRDGGDGYWSFRIYEYRGKS